jgi:hypothetical protein
VRGLSGLCTVEDHVGCAAAALGCGCPCHREPGRGRPRQGGGDVNAFEREWNDPDRRAGQTVSRTAPMCWPCWQDAQPHRRPVRVVWPNPEVCHRCGAPTIAGIYVRKAPDRQTFKAWQVR